MKKKLGDLTIRELKDEQDIICKSTICKDCPFKECCITYYIDLDQEVEVEKMNKLNIKQIQKEAIAVFDTKKELLDFIKKSSFKKDDYSHYTMEITYSRNKKWLVQWR